jgi:hypothetical protein
MINSALILKQWFCDDIRPSDLVKEFPFLDKGELSECSDFNKVIEADLKRSWDVVEDYYRNIFLVAKQEFSEILSFISLLRSEGYDRIFRAGISVSALVFSRAMRQVLRLDQPCLIFELSADSKINIYTSQKARFDGNINLRSSRLEFTPQIENLFNELEREDIT